MANVHQRPRPRLAAPAGLRELLLPVGLFTAAFAISAFTILQGVDPFDEGLVLQAARRVAHGQVPYRDFQWAYGPAQPYLLAGLAKLLGPSLIHWRVLRSLADAGVSLVVFGLVRREAGTRLGLVAWLVTAGAMAEPRSANPFPFALLLCLVAIGAAARRRVGVAAVCVALAAAFRLDFALYALAGVMVAFALGGAWRRALLAGALAVAGIALVYLPFAILDGPAALYDGLVGISLREGGSWSLPFPLAFHAAHQGAFEYGKHLIDFYVPLLLLAGLLVAVAALAWRRRPPPPLAGGVLVFALGALAYLLSRTDEFHTAPLIAALAVILCVACVRAPRPLALAGAVVVGLLLVHGVANRASALTRPPALSALRLDVADGAMAPAPDARALERVVALIDARVPPGQPIYVLPQRSDLVRFNDPLIYVLADRPNPSSQDFGLVTGAAAQRRIVATLARARPRVIVRWTDPISAQREPNLRGRSSGVRTVDTWVAAHYRPLERLYHFDVLVQR